MNIGIIGCGDRITTFWKTLKRIDCDDVMKLVSVADIQPDMAAAQLAKKGLDTDSVRFYADAEKMLDEEKLDGVLIGTRCSSHAHYARMTLRRGIPLFLEKPVVTTEEDLAALEKLL